MEVYEGIADPDLFTLRMAQVVDEYDIEMFIDGRRHVECFVDTAMVPAACAPARDNETMERMA
jgi:hypothetical protein